MHVCFLFFLRKWVWVIFLISIENKDGVFANSPHPQMNWFKPEFTTGFALVHWTSHDSSLYQNGLL